MAGLQNPFPARVEHHSDEPAYSLLLRTSLHNGLALVHTMFDLAGPRVGASLSKLPPAEVARLCKADPVAVALATPAVSPARVDVLGETLNAEHFSLVRRRWCPHCLAEHGYHRVWWDITVIRSCPFHKVELASDCGCEQRPVYWRHNLLLMCRRGHDLRKVVVEPAESNALAMDGYLVRRMLQLDQSASRLDAIALTDLLTICERVGQVSKDHASGLMQLRRSNEQGELHAEGFRILSSWPTAFHELLDRLVSSQDQRRGAKGVWKAYGEFYNWVRELPDHKLGLEMKRELRRHAEQHLTLKTGTRIDDGAPVKHDTVSVEQACGLGYVRFRELLTKLGVTVRGEGIGARADMPHDEFDRLLARVKGFKILKQVTTELGIDAVAVAELARSGQLDLIAEGTGGSDWYFPASAPSDLIARLWALASRGKPEPGRHLPVIAAAEAARVSLAQAINRMLAGDARVFIGGTIAQGFEGIFVNPAELIQKGQGEGVALSIAAEMLGLKQSGLDAVLEAGLIRLVRLNGIDFVPDAEIRRFRETYVGIVELRPTLGVRNFQLAATMLAKAGIEPIVSGARLIDHVYLRRSASDLSRWISDDRQKTPARGRNRKDIAKELYMEASMLRQLVEANLISMQPGCRHGSIHDSEVARFKAAYATSSALAQEFGISGWKTIIALLESGGVKPICQPPQFEAFLFPRPEAEKVLAEHFDAMFEAAAQPERGPSVKLKEAAAQLGMAYNMATELARANILPNYLDGRAIMVELSEIENFRRRYILGNELGALAGRDEHRGSGAAVTNRLLQLGLRAVCSRPQFYSFLFEREAALAAMKEANLLRSA